SAQKPEASLQTKVLLIGLSVALVSALGGIFTLGMKREKSKVVCFALDVDYRSRFEELYRLHEETQRKLNRLNRCGLCAKDWVHSGGKCYFFSRHKMNWMQSRDHCVTLGGHLDFLTSNVKETHWIGLNDLEKENSWVWVNHQPLDNSTE
ncbi:hypothetical protein DNTS_035673, partial [Danionella cerebrum]